MQTISPEQLAGLTAGATPTQIVILILLGATVCSTIFIVVVNIVKLYIAPIQKEQENTKKDRDILNEIRIEIAKISKSLWSQDTIKEKIKTEINQHALDCPCRNQKGK